MKERGVAILERVARGGHCEADMKKRKELATSVRLFQATGTDSMCKGPEVKHALCV